MFSNRRPLILILALTSVAIQSDVAAGQHAVPGIPSADRGFDANVDTPFAISIQRTHVESEAGLADRLDADAAAGKFRTRQAFLLSGVAVSMLAYGYFALQFNNRRGNSETARLTYEADVRENAQFYVDQGVSLDQIPTYFAWESAFTDAANARELIAVAGLSAFLLGMAAILDAATNVEKRPSESQARTVTPLVGVSPSSGDLILGARVGL